ncbi:MAG: hypothetical protein JRG73_00445 [Deltaproteobacteria bacterium]|nr:hypothetical protein [Deltaproteobacteria bacterium]MBW2305373.1 hypothetical protein [Deltaproteobacteria bacterium]
MITPEEEKQILNHAYIPEHIVGLMTSVSGGEPFLIEDYFCCRRKDWIVVVGYPLQNDFIMNEFERALDKIIKRFRPRYVSLIAPELPLSLAASCRERESDHYYTLDIHDRSARSGLIRAVKKAMEHLTVERAADMRKAHYELSLEFIERVNPSPRIRNLLFKMPDYITHSSNSVVLNAWSDQNNLAAFYIVDLAAGNFSTYVIGCHSKKNYVKGASDLLFFEMIKISNEYNKKYIHLGLGVNKGIRQFKEKWGGIPTRGYEMCELVVRKPSIFDALTAIRKMKRTN